MRASLSRATSLGSLANANLVFAPPSEESYDPHDKGHSDQLHVAQSSLAQWFLAQKVKVTSPPKGYEARRGQLDDGPLLIHRETRIYIWPHMFQLGTSLREKYHVLFTYCTKRQMHRLLLAGSSENLWVMLQQQSMERRQREVFLSDRDPAAWANKPWQKQFMAGRLLLCKAKILHYSTQDTAKFEFTGDNPADWCVALRVPAEWIHEGINGWWTVWPEQLPVKEMHFAEKLFAAVDENDPVGVKTLIEQHADPNAKNRTGWQPLMIAAAAGYIACARELMHHGANVNAQNGFGGRPLGLAVVRGHTRMLEELIDARAGIDDADQWQETALHLAAKSGHAGCTAKLLELRADIWKRNLYGDTPFDLAKARGSSVAPSLRAVMDSQDRGVELPYPLPRDAKHLEILAVQR